MIGAIKRTHRDAGMACFDGRSSKYSVRRRAREQKVEAIQDLAKISVMLQLKLEESTSEKFKNINARCLRMVDTVRKV
jgi:hypothetical protein